MRCVIYFYCLLFFLNLNLQDLDEEESAQFFTSLLPKIISLALSCPELIKTAIPLLKKKENRTVSLRYFCYILIYFFLNSYFNSIKVNNKWLVC
jgi:hypothetical protein